MATVYRKDYKEPAFLVDSIHLDMALDAKKTKIHNTIKINRNPKAEKANDIVLQGEHIDLVTVSLDGQPLDDTKYRVSDKDLTVFNVPDSFTLETEVFINPSENTALSGLYQDSGGMLCTQCEAQGFRRITYMLDRPDVLSRFTVRLEGDKATYPVLLANGNPIDSGNLADNRHYVVWEDPFLKPTYLFAVVAGDLEHIEDTFTTMSGRDITLRIFTEEHNLDKTQYAMDALKRAMLWDERVFGREYDLDLFMIVAVDAFNFGAMENKGLNIFNASAILTEPQMSRDEQFMRVEAIVAHEYFHNWSGNRVTCRSWFELSLKEGFTVFRDAEFSADTNDRAVKRIEDVALLRAIQFPEDSGPMAHPIRPDSYEAIDNFYTATVYEKGCEVVRMIHTLLGAETFRKGSDLYFSRHDGQAVTCDDFVKAMEDASGIDLTQFRNWYSQEGTPELFVSDEYDADKQTYSLTIKQTNPKLGKDFKPYHLPFKLGLLDSDTGKDLSIKLTTSPEAYNQQTGVLSVTKAKETFTFKDIATQPVPSLLRGFSAPIKLHYDYSKEQLAFIAKHDRDGFNRYEAIQRLAIQNIQEYKESAKKGDKVTAHPLLISAIQDVLEQANAGQLSPALAAYMVSLPSLAYLQELEDTIDLEGLQRAQEGLRLDIGQQLSANFETVANTFKVTEDYAPKPKQIGKRALHHKALEYLTETDMLGVSENILGPMFEEADNMTDTYTSLRLLIASGNIKLTNQALDKFYERWQSQPLALDTWFSLQARNTHAGTTKRVRELLNHESFSYKRPNSVRSLIGSYAASGINNFHHESGEGYALMAEQIAKVDTINPSVAARISRVFDSYKRYDDNRKKLVAEQLEKLANIKTLSSNTREIIEKLLA